MAEWFKAHAWKACVGKTTVGSNPTLSANSPRNTGFVMTGLQKVLVAIAFAAVGVGLYEIRQAARLRGLNQRLQQLEATNVELIEQIASEHNDATNRLALLMNENESLRENSAELLRLRGMVGRLQADLRDATAAKPA